MVDPIYVEDPVRRADIARALPGMHAVVFVCDAESKGAGKKKRGTRNVRSDISYFENKWMKLLNEQGNRHTLQVFVIPKSPSLAPGCDVQIKPVVKTDAKTHVLFQDNTSASSYDVRTTMKELIHLIQPSLSPSETQALLSQQASSSTPQLNSSGKDVYSSLSEAIYGYKHVQVHELQRYVVLFMQLNSTDPSIRNQRTPLTL